ASGTSAPFAIVSRVSPGAITCQRPAGLSGCIGACRPGQPAAGSAIATIAGLSRRLAAAHAKAALQIDVPAARVIRSDVMVTLAADDRQFLLLRPGEPDHTSDTVV